MALQQLPPVSQIQGLSTAERAAILDALFEPSPQLHSLSVEVLQKDIFSSYSELVDGVGAQLTSLANSASTSDTKWLDEILRAHPRLGEKRINSAQSVAEQAQLKTGDEDEGTKLTELNDQYEREFPHLKFVTFVNGRSRPVIMGEMQARIDRGDVAQERLEAIQAMCEIAKDRARKLISISS